MATSFGNDAAAKQAFKVLGELRGIATKVGQTLSYVDGVIPERHRETYESALRQLQSSVPSSSPAEARSVVERELGSSLEDWFAEWSALPVASASIGQVHRARLPDGTPVAVKVQHPEVQSAVESDLSNVAALLPLIGLALPSGLDPSELLAEVTQRFREELDYRREAQQTSAFGAFWDAATGITIPQVVPTHSTARILTTSWLHGETLEAAALGTESARRAHAESMWTFVFRSLLVGGAFNADPHPGNYFFGPDGGVSFLDFGCVQLLPDAARRAAVMAHRGAVERNRGDFRAGMTELLQLRPGKFADAALSYVDLCFAPIFDSPFRISREWATHLTRAGQESKSAMLGKGANLTLPPAYLAMMNRLQFGFYSVLARLDVEVDYRALEARIVEEGTNTGRGRIRELILGGA